MGDLGLGKEFLNLTPKAQFIKENFDKLALIKIKNGCSVKAQVKRIKRQAKSQEKIFTNYIPKKGLVSRMCKELSKLNNIK